MSIMESEIIGLTNQVQGTADDYWRQCLNGTSGFSQTTALSQLEECDDQVALQAKIALLTNSGQFTQANALLGTCVVEGTADPFCEVQTAVLSAAQNQTALAELDDLVLDELEMTAALEDRDGSAQALAILELARDTWQDEIILFPDGSRSLLLLPNFASNKEHVLNVFPNPAQDNVFVTFDVFDGVEDVRIAVVDLQGKEILNEPCEPVSGIFELKMDARASGIYKVVLHWDDIMVDEQSLEVIH